MRRELEKTLKFVEQVRNEVVTIFVNHPEFNFSEQVLIDYSDGHSDISIAIGELELTLEERFEKLANAQEHFRIYITECWELIIAEMLEDLSCYAKNYKKPAFCPKRYITGFRKAITTDIQNISIKLKKMRSKKATSNKFALETVNKYKEMYESVYKLKMSVMNKSYQTLQNIENSIKNKTPIRTIFWAIIGSIISAIIGAGVTVSIFLLS